MLQENLKGRRTLRSALAEQHPALQSNRVVSSGLRGGAFGGKSSSSPTIFAGAAADDQHHRRNNQSCSQEHLRRNPFAAEPPAQKNRHHRVHVGISCHFGGVADLQQPDVSRERQQRADQNEGGVGEQ